MQIRDRIKELRRVKASELRPNPKNWRTHPENQQNALRGVLAEIGWAAATLARELPDGSLMLIDGHLRAEIDPGGEVPVLVLDVNEAEADLLLAAIDPLASMAETDAQALGELLHQVNTENESVQAMLGELAADNGIDLFEVAAEDTTAVDETPPLLGVLIECVDEAEQRKWYELLKGKNSRCRCLTL